MPVILGIRLRHLRDEKGLTQRYLADAINVSQSTIALYEGGKRDPDPDTLDKLAQYFHVSTDFLLGRTSTRAPAETMADDIQLAARGMENLPPEDRKFILDYIKVKTAQHNEDKDSQK